MNNLPQKANQKCVVQRSGRRLNVTFSVAVMCTLLLVCAAMHGSGLPAGDEPDYDLSWHTIDTGGGTSTGGDYELSGTIGQPDAGVMSSGAPGNEYTLAGGFWPGGANVEPECPIVGDVNCDGIVDVQDLLLVISNWGTVCDPGEECTGDANGDGVVDVLDLLMVISNWGNSASP